MLLLWREGANGCVSRKVEGVGAECIAVAVAKWLAMILGWMGVAVGRMSRSMAV